MLPLNKSLFFQLTIHMSSQHQGMSSLKKGIDKFKSTYFHTENGFMGKIVAK